MTALPREQQTASVQACMDAEGQLYRYADGGYPFRYFDRNQDDYCAACAQEILDDGAENEWPIEQGEVHWEVDHPDSWPQCTGCHKNLEVAYPPQGFDEHGEPNGQPLAKKPRRRARKAATM